MAQLDNETSSLVGRERELAALDGFLATAAVDGRALLLTGDPGVGKSALLAAAAERAASDGIRVISAGGVEYETDVSLAGLYQLVDPLREDLEQLPAASREALRVALGIGSGPAPERLVLLGAALALLRRAATGGPLLVVIDDMHWLDRATASVIGFVGRRVGGSRIGLLGATRPSAGGFFERTGWSELDVPPLGETDSMELLAHQFAHLPARVRREVAHDAQGNPLALLEFAAAVDGHASPPNPAAPGSSREVHSLYAARIERLPEETRRLLLLAALDGSGSLSVLAAAGGSDGLASLGPAERDHLVIVDERDGSMRFRHPMIKSVVAERSTHDERRMAHQRLASVCVDRPERRGHHLAEAALAPDEEVAEAVEEGAHRTLERGDVVGAVARLVRAADLSPEPAARSRRLAEAAFIGAFSAGRLESSSRLLRDAQRGDPTLGATLRAAVATAYMLLNSDGDTATAHRLLTEAMDSAVAGPNEDRDGISSGLYTLVVLCHYARRPDYWEAFHRVLPRVAHSAAGDALLLAETFADPLAAPPAALARLDRAVDRLGDTRDAGLIIRTAIAGFYVDRLSGCRHALDGLVRDGREGGAVASALMALNMRAFDDYSAGRWDAAQRSSAEGTALCDELGYRLYGWSNDYLRALIAAHRGESDICSAACEAMVEWAAPRQLGMLEDYAQHALTAAALSAGDYEESYAHAAALTPPGTLRSHVPQALWTALDLVDAALHTGRTAEARAHAEAMRDSRLDRLSPRYALVTTAALAMVGSGDDSLRLFARAVALPGVEAFPFELARVRLAYGQRLRRLRHQRDARVQLEAARDVFDRLGAAPWSLRATTELRATGARHVGHPGGIASLTSQELEVARLAASGLSNREIASRLFVSPRTVSAHLYRLFPKLGITSRAALRDALGDGEVPARQSFD